MCEYCGCQALASIAELTAEHDAALDLIGRAGAAVEAGQLDVAAEWAGRIAALLGPHTAVEEQGLFPALADDFPEHVQRLVGQHRAIELALAGPGPDLSARKDWGERLAAALYLLREHILAEQDGVFPAALSALGPQDWEAVEAVRGRVGSALARAAMPRPVR